MIRPKANIISIANSGYWRVIVHPMPQSNNSAKQDVTYVRGAATTVSNLTTTDPFGPATATLIFPSVTILDTPGMGELSWLVPEADVDIQWVHQERFDVSRISSDGTQITVKTKDVNGIAVGEKFVVSNTTYYSAQEFTVNSIVDSLTFTALSSIDEVDETVGQVVFRESVKYVWQGYFLSFEYGEDDAGGTLSVQCNGAMKQLDNFLAKPSYPDHPLTYEQVIEGIFSPSEKPSLRLSAIKPYAESVPDWWTTKFKSADYAGNTKRFSPQGLQENQAWSGMLTRATGSFEPCLNFVQGLLAGLQTQRGSFTILLDNNRRPYFKHRDRLAVPAEDTLTIDLLWPGVQVGITQDFSQRLNVVYGKGKALSGYTYSNIEISSDGKDAYYKPFAARPQVDPTENNSWLDKNKMRKEVSLSFYDGLDASEAEVVARKHLEMFSEPGITGQVTLKTDPLQGDVLYPRQTITAGMSILIKGIFGDQEGVLFHITEASCSEDSTVSLTIDSKFRDQVTVQEIRKRGKDSLVLTRILGIGQYQPNISDVLFPWSYDYSVASGYVPRKSAEMWKKGITNSDTTKRIPSNIEFPWSDLVTNFAPVKGENKSNEAFFAKIPNAASKTNATSNWTAVGVPVTLAAQGQIIATKFAAFDAEGNPYRVPFHVSIWYENVNSTQMPILPLISTLSGEWNWKFVDNVKVTVHKKVTAKTRVCSVTNIKSGHGLKVGDWVKFTKCSIAGLNNTYQKIINVAEKSINFTVPNTIKSAVDKTVKLYTAFDFAGTADPSGALKYSTGQRYPFFESAWEQYDSNGSLGTNPLRLVGVPQIAGWGTFYQKAGYYPGSGPGPTTPNAVAPTGLFVDETPYSFNFVDRAGGIPANNEPYVYKEGTSIDNIEISKITAYVMFYCDQEWDDTEFLEDGSANPTFNTLIPRQKSVYFAGRLYYAPPNGQ